MKTDGGTTAVPVWTNNVEILAQEECLPVIGNCQVSSILQTLSTNDPDGGQQNIDLIILPSGDLKVPVVENSFTLQNSYIILNEKSDKKQEKQKSPKDASPDDSTKKKKENFEDMLYFVCNLCPFLCTKDTKITEHLENAHKNKNVIKLPELKCPACSNVFYHKLSLRSHLIHDHGVGNSDLSRIIQAVIYYSNKKSKEKRNQINKALDIRKTLEAEQIEQENQSQSLLNTDTSSENYEDLSQKDDLGFATLPLVSQSHGDKTNNSLKKNADPVLKLSDSKKYKCVISSCNVKLQDVEKLNYHIKCHTENGFVCNDCGEKFLFWKPLSSHLWRFHKIDMDLFSCDKCEYKTYSLSKLNNIHKLIHGDVKSFVCNVCSKAFKNCKQLRNHKITHRDKSEKLVHVCEVCSKSFADRRQLKVHMDVVHKKIRPFLCSYCGYKGSSRSSLKMHIRQHTGEKPFSCNFCSYTTSDHNSLRRHNLRHTGQKPYKCSYCSYACIQTSTYKTHLKTKHPGMEKDLMFTCHECQFRSVNKDIYVLHMIDVHKMKPDFDNSESSY